MRAKQKALAVGAVGLSLWLVAAHIKLHAIDSQSLRASLKAAGLFVLENLLRGSDAAPALMLCFVLVLLVPILVLVARFAAWLRRAPEVTRRYRKRPFIGAEEDVSVNIAGDAVMVPGHASVEIVGERSAHYAILRDMLRIGREDDNDIRIPSQAVHRYHAAIHREDIGDYWITDLSGTDGNGLVVNGQRCGDARLHDGDLIELGPGRLRFHAGLL